MRDDAGEGNVGEDPDREGLAGRLQRVEDELSIARLLSRCAHAVDYGDEETSLDSFTDDATWQGRHVGTGETFIERSGKEQLAAFFRAHTRAPHLYHKHFVADIKADIHGDDAHSQAYVLFVVSGPGSLPALGGFGRYHDEIRRCPDGQWRIASRLAEVEAWNPLFEELARTRRRMHLASS